MKIQIHTESRQRAHECKTLYNSLSDIHASLSLAGGNHQCDQFVFLTAVIHVTPPGCSYLLPFHYALATENFTSAPFLRGLPECSASEVRYVAGKV